VCAHARLFTAATTDNRLYLFRLRAFILYIYIYITFRLALGRHDDVDDVERDARGKKNVFCKRNVHGRGSRQHARNNIVTATENTRK